MASSYSVVMTAYNEERWIADAIASVLAQTHAELELIVVDDGSTDATVEQVERFADDSRLRLVRQENAGLSAARNTGIAASESDWVAFLDSDDLWMPTYLERVDATLTGRPEVGFAYVDAWRLDPDGRFFREQAMARQHPPSVPPADPTAFLRLLVEHGNFIFVSTTVRRAALEEAGGFKVELTSCEDFDLWIRILAAGHGVAHPDGRLAIKRDRPTAMSANERKMVMNLRDVYNFTARDYPVPDDVRASARRAAEDLDATLVAIERDSTPRRARRRLRLALGSAWRETRSRQVFHPETPPEVRAAFPHLGAPKT